jgi:hypothetical protein
MVFNKEIVGSRIPEGWLDEELCAKCRFCGEELVRIKRQLGMSGRAVIVLKAADSASTRQGVVVLGQTSGNSPYNFS